MTSPTPELVTAEQAAAWVSEGPSHGVHINNKVLNAICQTIIALHEALAAEKAKIAELEAGASRSLFALMTDRALAAEARALAAEARVAVMRGLLHAALTTRAMDDLEWQLDARAALETEAGDE